MEKEFIPYEQALALKELGFDKPCLLRIQYSSGTDVFTGRKFKNSIWLGNGYEADIDDKKIKYKFPKHTEQGYGHLKIPLYQQAFRWFREKHNLKSWVQEHIADTFIYEIRPHVLTYYKKGEIYVYANYEEAELACLKKLIEIVKKNKMKKEYKTPVEFVIEELNNVKSSTTDQSNTIKFLVHEYKEVLLKAIKIEKQQQDYSDDDVKHLEWMYNRMIEIHGENTNYDYMIKLKNIIETFKNKRVICNNN
jgi:hypothetical protein